MRTSTNYHFNLPELSDVADVTKLTANWESLDSTLRIFAIGLADVEDTVHQMNTSDLPAIRQSVTDVSEYAESVGESVTALDTEIHTTRPYVDTNTEQTITAKKHIPTATVNDDSDVWVNKAFVQATDGRNNLVHNIADEDIYGTKRLLSEPIRMAQTWATYQCRSTDAQQGAIPDTTQTIGGLGFTDVNSAPLGGIVLERTPDEIHYLMYMYDVNGEWHGKIIMRMTYNGQVIE